MKKLITLGLLLVGCVQVIDAPISPSAPVPSEPIVTVAPLTVPPTVDVPSVAPRVTPTPSPQAVSGDWTPWTDYLTHGISSSTAVLKLFGELSDALTISSLPRARRAALALENWANDQITWFDLNPPAPCYQSVYDVDLETATVMLQFTNDLIGGIDLADPSLLKTALGEEKQINLLIQQSTALMDDASANCAIDEGTPG